MLLREPFREAEREGKGLFMKRMFVVAVAAVAVLGVGACSGKSDSKTAAPTTSAATSAKAAPASAPANVAKSAGTKQACTDSEAAFKELAGKQDEIKSEAAAGNYEAVQAYYQSFTARIRKSSGVADDATVKNGLESIAKLGDAVVHATTTDELKAALVKFGTAATGDQFDKVGAICDAA